MYSLVCVRPVWKPHCCFSNDAAHFSFQKLTEGRVVMFNHEVVPDYLRTKPEPEVEEKTQQLTNKASQITQELAQVRVSEL